MPAGATYEPLATITLGSAGTITFSGISGSYTDLRLVIVGTQTSQNQCNLVFNSDTGTNYSYTSLIGNGSTASSGRSTNANRITVATMTGYTGKPGVYIADIFNYAGSTNKTVLCQSAIDQAGSGDVERLVNLWRSTAAITTILINAQGANFDAGTTATLYGIKAA